MPAREEFAMERAGAVGCAGCAGRSYKVLILGGNGIDEFLWSHEELASLILDSHSRKSRLALFGRPRGLVGAEDRLFDGLLDCSCAGRHDFFLALFCETGVLNSKREKTKDIKSTEGPEQRGVRGHGKKGDEDDERVGSEVKIWLGKAEKKKSLGKKESIGGVTKRRLGS